MRWLVRSFPGLSISIDTLSEVYIIFDGCVLGRMIDKGLRLFGKDGVVREDSWAYVGFLLGFQLLK
jgi:hypothetical protein